MFGCLFDATYDDVIMSGMLKAAEDGVDIISMSLGSSDAFVITSVYADIVQSITAQGIAVIAANGNDGALGLYFESTPANVPGALAVGSVTNSMFPAIYNAQDAKGTLFPYASVWPLEFPKGMNVWYHGSSCDEDPWITTANAVQALNASITIVVVGTSPDCFLSDMMSAASVMGVQFLAGYNIATDIDSQDQETTIPFPEVATIVLDPATGAKLVKNVQADPKYILKFPSASITSKKMITGGMMSNYSSFGSSWDTINIKPQLSAPGGKIMSTYAFYSSKSILS